MNSQKDFFAPQTRRGWVAGPHAAPCAAADLKEAARGAAGPAMTLYEIKI